MTMKKNFILIMMLLSCTCASAQSSKSASQQFLDRFTRLVARVDVKYADNPDSVDVWKTERKNIQILYKERYKEKFTDDELEKYASINGRYRSKMTELHLSDLSEKMDTLGSIIDRGVRRTKKKVSGFIKGMKEQSDKNRKND